MTKPNTWGHPHRRMPCPHCGYVFISMQEIKDWTMSNAEISKLTGTKVWNVSNYRSKHGLPPSRPWRLYPHDPKFWDQPMTDLLKAGVKRPAVYYHWKKLGINRQGVRGRRSKLDWTAVNWSKRNFEIAKQLGCSPAVVWAARKRINQRKYAHGPGPGRGFHERINQPGPDWESLRESIKRRLQSPEPEVRSLRVVAKHCRVSDRTLRRWLAGIDWPTIEKVNLLKTWLETN